MMTADDAEYTRDELVTQLRRLAAEMGHSPTMDDLRETSDYPSVNRFLDEFGTWNAAKEAADLDTYRKEGRGETYSREELIERLQQLAQDVDGMVTREDVDDADSCPSSVTYQRHFGSWNAAKEAAGLEPVEKGQGKRGPTYSDTELLQLLRDLATEIDGPLTAAALEAAEEYPSLSTYKRRFGSWTAAKAKAGVGEQSQDK